MAQSNDTPPGFTVTVTPSQSAFFAGELFSATITLSNPAPIVAPPSRASTSNLFASPPKTALPAPGVWRDSILNNPGNARKRPPSASHIGLAEYATNNLDSDEVPESPYIGGANSTGTFSPQASTSRATSLAGVSAAPPDSSIPKPSTPFGLLNPAHRSVSGFGGLNGEASTSKPNLPSRKGLIGKPLVADRGPSGGGLYDGPRRPLAGKHGRSQSTVVSNPDLRAERTPSGEAVVRSHGKGRLGGSLGGEAMMEETKRKTSLLGRGKNWFPASYEDPRIVS